MAACAINLIKPVVFEWFHFFYLFIDLVSCHILVSFGDPGDTFSGFGRYRNRDRNRDSGRDRDRAALGRPRLRAPPQWKVTELIQLGSK